MNNTYNTKTGNKNNVPKSPRSESITALSLLKLQRKKRSGNHLNHSFLHQMNNHDHTFGPSQPPLLYLLSSYSSILSLHNINTVIHHHHHHLQQSKPDYRNEKQHHAIDLNLGITEISGEAGSGKTQLVLSLCVSCILTPIANATSNYSFENVSTSIPLADLSNSTSNTTMNTLIGMKRNFTNHDSFSMDKNTHSSKKTIIRNPYNTNSTKNTRPTLQTPSHLTQHDHLQPPPQSQSLATNSSSTTRYNQQPSSQYYKAIYISMGEGIPSHKIAYRLNQMITARVSSSSSSSSSSSPSIPTQSESSSILERIITQYIHNEEEFQSLLYNDLIPLLTKIQNVGVIVLDSIAGIFRTMEESTTSTSHSKSPQSSETTSSSFLYSQRSQILFDISSFLKKVSFQFGIPIIVVNQVTNVLGSSSNNNNTMSSSSTTFMNSPTNHNENMNPTTSILGFSNYNSIPSLGLSWSHCVNERLIITRGKKIPSTIPTASKNVATSSSNQNHSEINHDTEVVVVSERKISSLSSPRYPQSFCKRFKIEKCGAILISENDGS